MSLPALVVSAFAAGFGGVNDSEPLHHAARTGNVIQAHFAVMRCPRAVNAPCALGKGLYPSPVHTAASRNHVGVLKLLLARGGDANDPGKAGWSPLQLAAMRRSDATAELLLQHGAALDIFSAAALGKWDELQGWFRTARRFGYEKYLANASTRLFWGREPLLNWAIDGGHLRVVELLIRHGARVNPYPRPVAWPQSPPLHNAIEAGRFDIAELLLKSGADVDAQDCDGMTALHEAAARRNVAAARFLLDHDANPDARQDFRAPRVSDINLNGTGASRWTPLHVAVEQESPELVAMLLARGASAGARDEWGRNSLDVAVDPNGAWEARDILGMWHDRREGVGLSPARVQCLKLLLRYGGKPTTAQK